MNQDDAEKIEKIIRDRQHAHQSFVDNGSKVYRTFLEMEKLVFSDGHLSKAQKELIALGISIASNCESCMEWHIHKALQAGATTHQVLEAIEVAIEMGGGQATVSARFALKSLEYHTTSR